MLDGKELGYAIKEEFLGDEEIKKNLIEIKKDIVKDFIESIKKNNPQIDNLGERLEKYLINDGSIEDVFKDIFRGCDLSFDIPEYMDYINEVKKMISSIWEIPTDKKLSTLKSEIMNANLKTKIQNYSTHHPKKTKGKIYQSLNNIDSIDIKEQENKFIKSVYERASKQIGKNYKRGGISPNTGFDCSGLRYRAFKEEGIKFSQRLNAHSFSDADVDLRKDQVKPGDFMFWDQKPGSKKKDPIYHIEMIISKPYIKNGKTYVRTLGSSTDAKDDCGNYVGKGVQIREREMKDYRHYGRPTYYYQLAQYEKTGSKNNLIAGPNKPSQDLKNGVLYA